jgi:K+-transporting ATPase ATPase C chain
MKAAESVGDFVISIRFIAFSLLILAGIYPLIVSSYASVAFPWKANGSLLYRKDRIYASALLSQNFNDVNLFHARPSAANYQTLPSGASNSYRTSKEHQLIVENRENGLLSEGIDTKACEELLYASGSGLDPHITPVCAMEQGRVLGLKNKIAFEEIVILINKNTELSILGFIGRDRVNAVQLNIDFGNLLHAR